MCFLECVEDELPFRLYLRFFDVLPRICPCVNAIDARAELAEPPSRSDSAAGGGVGTDIEIYLAPDHGVQSTEGFYQ
ncbi:jg21597, partial [Pararge aegeria aegeria]